MRKGRFAGLSDRDKQSASAPGLAQLLLFDFLRPADEDDGRVAADRAGAVQLAIPLLALADLLWSGVLLGTLVRVAPFALPAVGAVVAVLVLLDLALWVALKRSKPRSFAAVRLVGLHGCARGALWLGAALIATSGPGADSILVKASLVAGVGAAIPVLFTVPLLMLLGTLSTFAVVTLLKSQAPLTAIAAGVGAFLASLALVRARHQLFAARQRFASEWQANKARRFVADFEASGRGWFWETNADGLLTYASEAFANHLGSTSAELLDRRLDELLSVAGAESDADARRTLGFHLSARFPFSDLVVRAPAAEIWWSLSGNAEFDDYGRFLGFRGMGVNLSEERRSEAEASRLARYDSLTGLPNRAMMRAMLDQALANAEARRRGCALMMIDLDKFKQVNDTFGHPVGDKLLKQVARRLTLVLGEDGRPGRLGGDEFEAVLPGIEEQARLAAIAERLIEEVSRPYEIEGHEIVIGTSVGIAVALPGKAHAPGLIKDADVALYAAKAAGRGTFRFFAPEMHAEASERQMLEQDLREALGKDQLQLHFQPIVDSVSEEVVAFEALLRWHHPTRGTIPPERLIPLAEEFGLMPRIGQWVLRTACAQAAKWPGHIRVAVNLSPSELADPALPAVLTSTLASSRLDPDRLEIEIGEAAFLADAAGAGQRLARLRTLGVRLALDNFGTGHAGLGHLRDAPLDKIKIDQSFVRGAGEPGSRNAAIVRAIVVLAESLGMDTTAEGAETIEELALIRRLGCSQVQGFIFSNPVPAAEALALAKESRPSAEVIGFSRPPRHRLIRTGRLLWQGCEAPVRLRNISAGGAMFESDRTLEPGTSVELDLDEAGRLEAEVRWSRQGQTGLRFAEVFELKKLARPRPGSGPRPPKALKPQYLDGQSEAALPAGRSPLATKKGRRA